MSVQPGPPMSDEGLRWEVFPNGVTFGILGVRYHGAIYAGRKEIASFSGDDEDVIALKAALAATEARGYRKAIDIVAAALATAKAEPRRAPTERAGRICALGQLLTTLEASEGTTP